MKKTFSTLSVVVLLVLMIFIPFNTPANAVPISKVIKLDVPYFTQLNNETLYFGSGSRQANLTANAMLAFSLNGELAEQARRGNYKEPESLYGETLAKYGDTTDFNAQTQALKELGIESYWSHTLSKEDVLTSLLSGYPVVAAMAYKSSGHVVVIVGYDPYKDQWFIHDPLGIRYGSTNNYDIGARGAYDPYSSITMQTIYWDIGAEDAWGRIVTSVKGESTELPYNL